MLLLLVLAPLTFLPGRTVLVEVWQVADGREHGANRGRRGHWPTPMPPQHVDQTRRVQTFPVSVCLVPAHEQKSACTRVKEATMASPTAQYTDFSKDVIGRYVCNSLDEALRSMSGRPFDIIVIGGGSFGSALAQHALY